MHTDAVCRHIAMLKIIRCHVSSRGRHWVRLTG
jgi:hypothetical protein